ncbi:hypothetical protein [Flavobacterium sp. UBA6031]|uniref:hypothetical protein n=1 Tax=Flavobacterium sp. UBA6031 TaxID=1946551 RepID=UPI0025BFDA4E|nr:hypothetical protein [Flavobacterium sp. UBA6031]
MSEEELSTSPNSESSGMKSFPSEIFDELSDLLRHITVKGTSPEDKDILLSGSLVSMSACLPNVYGVYAERRKGRLEIIRQISGFRHFLTFLTFRKFSLLN